MGTINKAVISLSKYFEYKQQGVRRPFFQGKIVKVEIICKRCSKIQLTPFSSYESKRYKDLCTKCAASINTTLHNKKTIADKNSFRYQESYREKISQGVKRHYEQDLTAVGRRYEKRLNATRS